MRRGVLGAVEAAFSALMRLSLRLVAERTGSPGHARRVLDDPILLFVPVRLLLGLVTARPRPCCRMAVGVDGLHTLVFVMLAVAAFVLVFELLVPLLIVGGNPERVLDALLPSFTLIARAISPLTYAIARVLAGGRRPGPAVTADEAEEDANDAAKAYIGNAEQEGLIEGEERKLLQSIVDFGDTLVREVMTPRPDIVALRDTATVGDVRTLFREQEYSRFPVFQENLDNIAGFIFVKDLVTLGTEDDVRQIAGMLRPAVVVPETKRVPELLKQFQRQQTQCAIVVDEYGGTAGLVTIEDLLEEIVGEIRDEYDVESEPVVDEGGGSSCSAGRWTSARSRSGSASRSSAKGSRPSAAICCRISAGCRRSASGSRSTVSASRCSTPSAAASTRSGSASSPPRQRCERAGDAIMKFGFVSLIGRPNAGKSTLLNRLVGTKLAIVSDKPQTTRTRILGVQNYPDAQVVFLDTPGIHRPLHRMNVRMVDAAVETIREVDVVGLVVDVTEPPGQGRPIRARSAEERAGAGVPDPQQDRSREENAAAAHPAGIQPAWEFRRDHSGVGGDRRQRRPARARAHRPVARRRAALSGRLPDRSARSGCLPGNRPREAAAVHPCRAAVLVRRGHRPVRGTGAGRKGS